MCIVNNSVHLPVCYLDLYRGFTVKTCETFLSAVSERYRRLKSIWASVVYTVPQRKMMNSGLPHMFAHRLLSICLGKWKMLDASEFQTFCEFCTSCFTSGIVWAPPPTDECIAGHIQTVHVSSGLKICMCACVGLHMCVHSGMWFCSLPAICGFSLRYFPRLLFLLLWKTL